MRHRRNPLAGPGSSKTDNAVMWGFLIGGGILATVAVAALATRPSAAAATPAKVRCGDGTMQTDCTGHDYVPGVLVRCPDGTMQLDCTGHTTAPVVTVWKELDAAASPPAQIVAGKTYRLSFTGSIGGPEMATIGAFIQQAGVTLWVTGPADWPNAVDAADPTRVKVEGVAFANGALPALLALVPTARVWVKS